MLSTISTLSHHTVLRKLYFLIIAPYLAIASLDRVQEFPFVSFGITNDAVTMNYIFKGHSST